MAAKIGFLLKGYPRLSETFIAQEIYLLEQRGFEIEIFSLKAPREKIRHPVNDNIKAKVTYFPDDSLKGILSTASANIRIIAKFPLRYTKALLHATLSSIRLPSKKPLKNFFRAGWLVQKKQLGISNEICHLHSHFIHAPTEVTFYASIISGLKFSISAHAKDIYTSSPEQIRERVQASQFLMTCTEFNYHKIREIVGPEHAHKVNQVYHGVSLEEFKPSDGPPPELPMRRLLTVARIVDKKGYDDVLNAMVILRNKGIQVQYDIFGDGDKKIFIENLIASLGLEKQVHLHGAVRQPEVLAAYREGGIFILGSRESADGDRDGIPNSMAEAMSMCLPVVATNVSGIPELLENEVTGLLVPQRNPAELAAAIERLLTEKQLAARLGIQARKKVNSVFDAHACIDVCENLLKPFSQTRANR